MSKKLKLLRSLGEGILALAVTAASLVVLQFGMVA
jgi:hypothetical protein